MASEPPARSDGSDCMMAVLGYSDTAKICGNDGLVVKALGSGGWAEGIPTFEPGETPFGATPALVMEICDARVKDVR